MASDTSAYAGREGKIEKDREGREKGEDELLASQLIQLRKRKPLQL